MKRYLLVLFFALSMTLMAEEAINFLNNCNFSEIDANGLPQQWIIYAAEQEVNVTDEKLLSGKVKALKITIKQADKGKGAVSQKITGLPASQKLSFSANLKSSIDGVGSLQVKLKKNGKEIDRQNSSASGTEWGMQEIVFDTGEADELSVQLRFRTDAKYSGACLWFANPKLQKQE